MKIIKKIIAVAVASLAFGMVACAPVTDGGNQVKAEYTFVMPDGAPSLAAVALMNNYPEIDGHKINYKIVAASNIGPEFTNADIGIMPTNASAKLYGKGVKLNLLSVNVFGVLYMIGSQPITSLSDLKGEVVFNIGKGGTPDLLLKYFLEKEGVEYEESVESIEGKVALAYEADAPSVIAKMKQGVASYGVMGQPVVNNANKNLGTQIVLDFQAQWQKYSEQGSYPQAGVVIKQSVAQDSSFVNALYEALCSNGEYIMQNPDQIKGVLARFNSTLTFDFTAEVVNACNIGCAKAIDSKAAIEEYFTNIKQFDPTFIGGDLPDAGYYLEF